VFKQIQTHSSQTGNLPFFFALLWFTLLFFALLFSPRVLLNTHVSFLRHISRSMIDIENWFHLKMAAFPQSLIPQTDEKATIWLIRMRLPNPKRTDSPIAVDTFRWHSGCRCFRTKRKKWGSSCIAKLTKLEVES
jgi:hypothetical protein